jgi:hypothetical protein
MHEYEGTYTYGNGVIPRKVIPDGVILELLHGFASASTRFTSLGLREMAKEGNTHRRLDVRQNSMHMLRSNTSFLASLSKNVA